MVTLPQPVRLRSLQKTTHEPLLQMAPASPSATVSNVVLIGRQIKSAEKRSGSPQAPAVVQDCILMLAQAPGLVLKGN